MNMAQQTQGQPPGQPLIASSSSGGNGWQERGDVSERREILEKILQLLRSPRNTGAEWQQKLPEMVRRLEEALYLEASSKEEYLDLSTLENRITNVAKRISSYRAATLAKNVANNPNRMIPSPSIPGTTMIPTPGLVVTGRPVAPRSTATTSGAPGRGNLTTVQLQACRNGHLYNGMRHGNHLKPEATQLNGRVETPYIANGDVSFNQVQLQRLKQNNEASKMIPVPGLQLTKQAPQETKPVQQAPATQAQDGMQSEKERTQRKHQQYLALLIHARRCNPQNECMYSTHCLRARRSLHHVANCSTPGCKQDLCTITKGLLRHHTTCQDESCFTCALVRRRGQSIDSAAVSLKRVKEEPETGLEGPAAKKQRLEMVVHANGKGKALQVDQRSTPLDAKPPKVGTGKEVTLEAHSSTTSGKGKMEVETTELFSSGGSSKAKVPGISFIELFTPEQIKEHIKSLRLWVGQNKAKAEKNQAMEKEMSESACQLCAVERLTFEPPPLYCTMCGVRIQLGRVYYAVATNDPKCYICQGCYCNTPSNEWLYAGQLITKNDLRKQKNDNSEQEEAWVQCDGCNLWQHQVCALFNGRRNESGDVEYFCANCLLQEMEAGNRKPLPSTSILMAKDLPRTLLSDHLEQRLARKLRQERIERARDQGKSVDEVPGAEGLVVRVVSCTDKRLEVKPRVFDILKDTSYSREFNYRSKALLLFQKIEGVEVCIFGMYVQEFGSESPDPNNRRIYIAYLDSVKYFRPDVRTVKGEALRTFVYHELLIGYLEYSKRRGFGSCYIWACPPCRGEDYILYCHPEIQKTPKNDKLRDWYISMLNKAIREGIVMELTNFHELFFDSPDESKAPITTARLPYFDGDYWPGAAEEFLEKVCQQDDGQDRRKFHKKAASKKGGKRLAAQAESTNDSRDQQLMQKLGHVIHPMREDFIMVHLHYSCRHCRNLIMSGRRWICSHCKDFNLCNRCYAANQKLEEKERHPSNSWQFHEFYSVEVEEIAADTKDKDEIMESEFFDTRGAFLSLCQGNHYQHDTLRRAKHSSMMVLYHLHNPTEPAFVLSCNLCNQVIETGKGWKCDTCADFDICTACKDSQNHPHKLKPQLSSRAQNKEARKQRILQLRQVLDLLVHAAECKQCQISKCRNVKNLFRHGTQCRVRAVGGCSLCYKMWHILQIHARACKDNDCRVPRCKDLREHMLRSQLQSESRRRAHVMEMVRKRRAEEENADDDSEQ